MRTHAAANRILVPPREGRQVIVSAGQTFRVIDLEGGQVGDLFAFRASDPSEHLSASHTRAATSRLFPAVGDAFVSNDRRPLLELVSDDSPGTHDMLIAACDPARYEALGDPHHPSCADNLRASLRELGIALPSVPQPVNVFMNVPVADEGRLDWLPARTAPGDSITLRAVEDVLVVLSACPQDIVGINGGSPTPLAIDLL